MTMSGELAGRVDTLDQNGKLPNNRAMLVTSKCFWEFHNTLRHESENTSHVIAALLSRIINCLAFCPTYFSYFSSRSLLLKNVRHFDVFHKVSSTGAHIWPTVALPQKEVH